jgi:gluconate kinase
MKRADLSRFVVVSGLPASGKSTIGRAIAAGLALPFLDKDDFLESLFPVDGPHDADDRRKLSRLADESFRAQVLANSGAVLASWWKHPRSPVESGTPTEWLTLLPGSLVEVHCVCDPAVAVERFLARKRHPGHLDGHRSYDRLLAQFHQQSPLGPLGLGSLVEVDTNEAIDTEIILHQVNQVFETSRLQQLIQPT